MALVALASRKDAPRQVTWEQFVQLDEDDLRELVEGQLVEVEVPTEQHEHVVAVLLVFLGAWAQERKAGRVYASGYKVRIGAQRGATPDVQFYRRENPAKRTQSGVESGGPDLAVEVLSPSSVAHDRVRKLGWYASLGVPEYWLVDPEHRTLERLVLGDGGHYMVVDALEGDAVLAPSSFEGLAIPLAALWERLDEAGTPE